MLNDARTCPNCRLLNPSSAERCDCGYDFASASIQKSYASRPASNASLDKAIKDIRNAYVFGLFAGSVTLLVSIAGAFGVMEGYDLWNLIDVAIIFILAVWMGRKSRVAATLMFAYATVNMIYRLVGEGQPTGVLSLISIYFYARGMMGAYKHRALSRIDGTKAAPDSLTIKEKGPINRNRVLIYIGLLFLYTFAVGVVLGLLKGVIIRRGLPAPQWIDIVQGLTNVAVSILVFVRLGVVQRERAFAHAWCVGLGSWMLSFPLNVLLLGFTVTDWLAQVILPVIGVVIGVPIGRSWAGKQGALPAPGAPIHSTSTVIGSDQR